MDNDRWIDGEVAELALLVQLLNLLFPLGSPSRPVRDLVQTLSGRSKRSPPANGPLTGNSRPAVDYKFNGLAAFCRHHVVFRWRH